MIKYVFPALMLIAITAFSCDEQVKAHTQPVKKLPDDRTAVAVRDSSFQTAKDSLQPKDLPTGEQRLKKYFHPNMSHCGGALYGYYLDETLVKIESTHGAELGFTQKNIDFEKGEIKKIYYREYTAEWDNYSERYPDDEEFNPKKMTYSDTLYILVFGKKPVFKRYSRGKFIDRNVPADLVEELLHCTETMKQELASEKEPEKI